MKSYEGCLVSYGFACWAEVSPPVPSRAPSTSWTTPCCSPCWTSSGSRWLTRSGSSLGGYKISSVWTTSVLPTPRQTRLASPPSPRTPSTGSRRAPRLPWCPALSIPSGSPWCFYCHLSYSRNLSELRLTRSFTGPGEGSRC